MTHFSLYRLVILLPVLVLLVGCSLLGGDDDEPEEVPWDTGIPESEDFSASSGVWSPSGTRIAFRHSVEDGSADPRDYDMLWTYDFTTGERHEITGGRVLDIDWHPDGSRFVFNYRAQPQYLYMVDTTGRNLTPLTGPGSPNPDLEYTVGGKWSPNGETLLYSKWAGEPRGVSVMEPDGSGAHIIIPYGISPSWFPSGERIIYVNWDTTAVPSRRRQLYTARPDGSDIQKLTDLPESQLIVAPNVSPDGETIVFLHRGEDRSSELFLMGRDGTDIRQVTQGEGIPGGPEWHPDGTKILFSRFIPNVSRRLYVLDVETLEVEPVFPAQ